MRSPIGPPTSVPAATAPRKMNRCSCALRRRDGICRSDRRCSSWSGWPDRSTSRRSARRVRHARSTTVRVGRARFAARRRARPCDAPAGDGGTSRRCGEHDDCEQGGEREPGDAACPCGITMKAASSGPRTSRRCRRPGRSTAPGRAGRRKPCARRARIRDGTPTNPSDQRGGDQQHREARRSRSSSSPIRVKPMPTASEYGFGLPVGVDADERLQQRGGELEGERDQADLGEARGRNLLEQRIDRRQQRLHHVVEQVAEAQHQQDRHRGTRGGFDRRAGSYHAWRQRRADRVFNRETGNVLVLPHARRHFLARMPGPPA